MFMRFLPLLVLLMIAGAYWSRENHDMVEIERIDVVGLGLVFVDAFDPVLAEQYPDTVARVNGRAITGADLVLYQVGTTSGSLPEFDPLETAIGQELLAQAGERLGHVPTYEEMAELAGIVELNTLYHGLESQRQAALETAIGRGWPPENWEESEVVVKALQRSRAIQDTQSMECDSPTLEEVRSGARLVLDCFDFLAAERENAVIEYFVVWAE